MKRLTDKQIHDMILSAENHGEAGFSYVQTKDYIIALRELAALRAHNIDSAEPVAVKPLEWTRDGHAWIAIMFWGLRYRIHETPSGKFIQRDPLNGPEFFDTLEAAKAAAQADHETRIRSALASPPAKEVEITDVRIEQIARSYHDRTGDNETVDWDKCKSRYRTQVRKMVRNVLGCAALTNRTPDDEAGNG